MEKLYSIGEVAEKLGLSTKTLRRWEETGKFIGTRTLGGQRRYSLTDLQILDAIKHGTITGSDDILTIEQTAALFGVTVTTVTRWEDEGKIHPLITAGKTYYPRHRLLAKLEELKSTLPPEPAPAPIYSVPSPKPIPISGTNPHAPLPLSSHTPGQSISAHIPTRIPPSDAPPQGKQLQPLMFPATQRLSAAYTIPLNIMITVILIAGYHLLIARELPPPAASPGQVQGSAIERDESLILLDAVLDKGGNLRPRSLTTAALSLTPAEPPAAIPGNIYFDAGTQSLKMYRSGGWQELGPTQEITLENGSLVSGKGILPKGKDHISVAVESVSADSVISLTFTSDFSPAKKYWINAGNGSFTVSTDFPVSEDAGFSYFVLK